MPELTWANPALQVVSYNVRNGLAWDGLSSWPFRRRALAETIRGLDADLFGLQEVFTFQQRFLLQRLPGFESIGSGRLLGGRLGERCPFLYRKARLEVLNCRMLRLPASTPTRIATSARFRDRMTGREFRAVNTHLDHRSAEVRSRQAAALLEHAPGRPVHLPPATDLGPAQTIPPQIIPPQIVLGDFNETAEGAALSLLLKSGLRDTLGTVAPRGVGAATYHGFKWMVDGERIDLILVSEQWRIAGAEIVRDRGTVKPTPRGDPPSDHWPVSAQLYLP